MFFEPTFRDLIPLYVSFGYVAFFYILHLTIYRNHHKYEELRKGPNSVILSMRIREFWFWITSPIFNFFVRFKFSPNMITTLGFFISIAAAIFFSRGWLASAGWCVIIAGSMDFFDGRIARHFNIETQSGAFYDATLDRISEGFVFLGLMVFYVGHWMFYVTFLTFLFSILISYIKAKGETMGIDVSVGIMQRPERIVYIGVPSMIWPMLVPFLSPFIPSIQYDWGTRLGLIMILILGMYTVYVRFKKVFLELKDIERESKCSD